MTKKRVKGGKREEKGKNEQKKVERRRLEI